MEWLSKQKNRAQAPWPFRRRLGWPDELIRVNEMARNSLINLEEMSEFDVERMKAAFATLASIETVSRPPPVAARGSAA